jgi:crotonobetainyl-CoA:carnitine CoA-transferase CaiB-like acyl-CoA transferase
MLFADLGAEVLKLERPDGGDVYRNYGPKFIHSESTSFLAVNRNKKSIAVNLKNPDGREIARTLAQKSDVVVENFKQGTMEKLGLDYSSLAKENPRLIFCSISGFGRTGPYSDRGGFDLILQGMSGIMSVTGEPDRPPAKVGVPITDIGAGIFATVGILAALIARNSTGKGQVVDASLLEAGLGFSTLSAINFFADGQAPPRLGSASSQNAPYQAFPTKDGFINVGTGNEELWRKFCSVLWIEDLVEDPRFHDNVSRVKNQFELAAEITPAIKKMTTKECWDLFTKAGIPSGPIYDIGEAVADPHVTARNMILDYKHPEAGRVQNIAFPVKLSEIETGVYRVPPELGEHTREVLTKAGYAKEELDRLEKDGVIKQHR